MHSIFFFYWNLIVPLKAKKGELEVMSNYYEYQDICARIAERLMEMDGWKVYGYCPDESDAMTDYWSPAHWGGVAEKNGYVLCVNVYGSAEPAEIREYNHNGNLLDAKSRDKIAKLEAITMLRGASMQEEETARKAIEKIKSSMSVSKASYIVVGTVPGHMAHPPKCNWHIEKDGKYILKGNGLLKFSHIADYYRYDHYKKRMDLFKAKPDEWERDYYESIDRGTEEQKQRWTKERRAEMEKDVKLCKEFENWFNKVDCACGSTLGDGEYIEYETVTKTQYKKEFRPFCTDSGAIKEGQCFMLLSNFNYGCSMGHVYRIHVREDGYTYAYKLNGKYAKECTGKASSDNLWATFGDKFQKWIVSGAISWCEIREVKTPYQVEKVVKRVRKTNGMPKGNGTEFTDTASDSPKDMSNYEITEGTHTKTGEKIWLVKVIEKLEREAYTELNKQMKELGGYYSKFTHSFVFKEDPTDMLNPTEMLA